MSQLEDRVRRLEDRAEINELVVAYFLAADGDDLDGVGASFTDDAVFMSSSVVSASSKEQIVDFIRGARGHMGLTIHTPNYVQMAFQDDGTANGIVGAHLELVLAGVSIFGAVRYVDEYVRTDAGWKIRSRDMRTIHIAPWSEVGASLASDTPVRWPGVEPLASDFERRVFPSN
jgi:ketosteroid isomerase-like protein